MKRNTVKPDGVELALYACLRYEEATLKSVDSLERWDIDETEKQTILKWMNNRMKDINGRL